MGASTKTGAAPGTFAGFFGEGFKIAALCGHRDHGWEITMASRDWELDVISAELLVDGTELRSLGYRVWRRPAADVTCLRLSPFGGADEILLEAVLLGFYYPENPLLGACIWKDEQTAFYRRSAVPKPLGFPFTESTAEPGIVFAGRQAMGSFEIPLVVAVHDATFASREREAFFRMDVVDMLVKAAGRLPAPAAAVVLEMMRRKWYAFPANDGDFTCLYPVVQALAKRVASSPEERERWHKAHPNLLVARPVRRSEQTVLNRRRQALAWLRRTSPRPRLVQDGFASLGYPELEEACEQAHGFARLREPDATERRYIAVLQEIVSARFPRVVPEQGLPAVRVIENATAAWQRVSHNARAVGEAWTRGGNLMRYQQALVALDESLLAPPQFAQALATYLHELAHAFGGERSAAFSAALTDLIACTAQQAGEVARANRLWQAIDHARTPGTEEQSG